MRFRYEYATFANYSPRGRQELSERSRILCGQIKNGNRATILNAIPVFKSNNCSVLEPFLNSDRVLVPVPRSSPLVEGALWPTKTISEVLVSEGFGKSINSMVERVLAVKKSSLQTGADNRPSCEDHYNSLRVVPEIITPTKITLIDDVISLGRTTYSCAWRLREAYPECDIKIFAMMRTRGFSPDIENLVEPNVAILHYNSETGKTWMPD